MFVLRCELMEIFERWSQLPVAEESKLTTPSPLLRKLQEKQGALDQAMTAMTQLQRQVGLERLERGRKWRRGKSIMGYDSNAADRTSGGQEEGETGGERSVREEEMEWLSHSTVPSTNSSSLSSSSPPPSLPYPSGEDSEEVSNAVVVLRLRRLHYRTREVRKELNRSLLALFPGLHSSLTAPPPALPPPLSALASALPTSTLPSPSPSLSSSFLSVTLSSILRTCESLYGGGRSSSWKGLEVQCVLSAETDRVVGLIASLPLVLRAFIGLEVEGEGQQKGGRADRFTSSSSLPSLPSPSSPVTVLGVSVMGWGETLRSPFTRSTQSVFVLVQAQLTAAMQRGHPHHPMPSKQGSIPSSSSSSSSSSLYSLLLLLSRYHSLFSTPCALCHRLLCYAGDGVGFVPPVLRTSTGVALHEECREGWRRGLPALYPHAAPQNNPNNTTNATSSSSSSSTAVSAAPSANPPTQPHHSTVAQGASKPPIEQRGAAG